jgi:hypothetical protein
MSESRERMIIHKLILAREFGQQGYRWNRAFRQELWRRLTGDPAGRPGSDPPELRTGQMNPTDRNDGC